MKRIFPLLAAIIFLPAVNWQVGTTAGLLAQTTQTISGQALDIQIFIS